MTVNEAMKAFIPHEALRLFSEHLRLSYEKGLHVATAEAIVRNANGGREGKKS